MLRLTFGWWMSWRISLFRFFPSLSFSLFLSLSLWFPFKGQVLLLYLLVCCTSFVKQFLSLSSKTWWHEKTEMDAKRVEWYACRNDLHICVYLLRFLFKAINEDTNQETTSTTKTMMMMMVSSHGRMLQTSLLYSVSVYSRFGWTRL